MTKEFICSVLPFKEIDFASFGVADKNIDSINRVLFYDPSWIYENYHNQLDSKKRIQGIAMWKLFPKKEYQTCACGCGAALTGKKKKWERGHGSIMWNVISIINGQTSQAGWYLKYYYGDMCQHCNENEWTDVDHIIPVKHGGGGCWLSNYQLLCNSCHKIKTKKDFGWGEFKVKNESQTTLPL